MKLILSIATLISSLFTFSQNVYFPDANLKAFLVANTSINTNADTEIQLTEANSYTRAVSVFTGATITDLTGIQEFTNTWYIAVPANSVAVIPKITSSALLELHIHNNNLTQIDLSGLPNLQKFVAFYNQFDSINFSGNTNIEHIEVSVNQINSLDLSNNSNLTFLAAGINQLSALDLSNNIALEKIYLTNNNLTNINVTNQTLLEDLSIGYNPISSITLSNNPLLKNLFFDSTSFISLDFSGLNSLESVKVNKMANLTNLNVANGFNTNISDLSAIENPSLTCIQVDDTTFALSNFIKDSLAKFSLNCSPTIGLNKNEIINNLSIYPNPTNSLLNIDTKGEKIVSVRVFSVTGQLIETELNNNHTLDVSNYKNGMYILQLETNNGTAISRFIKQ